ncbi:peptide chain release factor N(5)-glutamine methyltransferase [Luteimonas fraxinea]|uniref:Release factor glutamine methyltransferase n=1 Tax=Luteimonas fraxinea TaxID=2901869 RepID=A0ABS8UAA7_9GAMM|nr:peptide chain release factor N(5)-glutamine methyltransferase [Luteimonas fraxinea]MCD9095917.1 peptide chain release factor N(5)-glutamine methyltransferase [Luteimonas fraxinea]UHH10908.1 peptide chain release factor N(5)-glutamine methyltransferase [Luteimonas fraxinea]
MITNPSPALDALLRDAAARIDATDARWLLAHAAGRSQTWLYAHARDPAPDGVAARFELLVARRAAGEPVAYLTGVRGFFGLDLAVTPATLIPRPETELLVELALAQLPAENARLVDLGTGSGAIALAIARERPDAAVLATDASVEALAVARANAQALAVSNVRFAHGDWYAPLAGTHFDVIASNPPYIEDADPHLAQGDLRFEPASALSSGADGLDAIRVLAAGALAHLAPGGWLLVEHGFAQGAAVRALFEHAGLVEVATERDLEARDRVTLGRAPGLQRAG